MLSEEKKHVVIIGAGFAGVRAALDLAKNTTDFDLTLVDSNDYHCFQADLYEVGTAILNTETKKDFRKLEGSVSIPLISIFKNKKVKVLIDTVVEVDLANKNVVLATGGKINFDFLVLSLGSTTNYFGIEGAQDFSHPFKNTADALNLRDDIEELVLQSDKKVQIMIAGGGFTGVELAAELSGFLKKLAKLHHKEVAEVIIIEASPTILPGMPAWAQQAALKRLQKLGIKILLSQPITKVTGGEIFSNGTEALNYDYLVWTTGVRGESLGGKILGVQTTKRGKILTQQDLSLAQFPNVFVSGDLSECVDPKRNCPLEATAWMAIEEGKMVAQNLAARLRGEKTKNFSSPPPVFVVPIGEKYALADLGFIKLKGLSAWVLKRLITLRYLLSILPPWQALTLWLRGVIIYGKND